eukprot:IDg12091t1
MLNWGFPLKLQYCAITVARTGERVYRSYTGQHSPTWAPMLQARALRAARARITRFISQCVTELQARRDTCLSVQ